MTVYEALTAAQNLVIEHGKTRRPLSMKDEMEDIDTIFQLEMLKSKYKSANDRKGK